MLCFKHTKMENILRVKIGFLIDFNSNHFFIHFLVMDHYLGKMPYSMIKKCRDKSEKYFDLERGNLKWPDIAKSQASVREVSKLSSIEKLIPDQQFRHLIHRMLEYDPGKRICAEDAILHPFFKPLFNHKNYSYMIPPSIQALYESQDESDSI